MIMKLRHTIALSTLPAALYVLIERGILRTNTAVQGARYDRMRTN